MIDIIAKSMMIGSITILLLFAYACCKISGDCDEFESATRFGQTSDRT